MNFKEFFNKLKKTSINDKMGNLLIFFLIGVLILITCSVFKDTTDTFSLKEEKKDIPKKEEQNLSKVKSTKDFEESVKKELKNMLEKTEGVGKAEVMIYFETGEEQVPAMNITDSTNTTEENDNAGGKRDTTQKTNNSTVVITNDGSKSKPLIVKKYKPKVTGVFVVAEGAENKITELRIVRAVVNLFNIPENKVNVYPMKE